MENRQLENRLKEMIKKKEECDRQLLAFEWVIGILSTLVLFILILIGAILPLEDWMKAVIVSAGIIPAIVGYAFALKIEQIAGYYECMHCKHRHIPDYKLVLISPHMGRTRYMKCPQCGRKSWQKKVIGEK